MGSNRINYVAPGLAALFLTVGGYLLPSGLGFFFLGMGLCALCAWGAVIISGKRKTSIRQRTTTKPKLKVKPKAKNKTKSSQPILHESKANQKSPSKVEPPRRKSPAPKKEERSLAPQQPRNLALKNQQPVLKSQKAVSPLAKGQGSHQPCDRLFRRYFNQDESHAFAHFYFNGPQGDSWEKPFERLTQIAEPEKWNFEQPEFQRTHEHFPILLQYLNYTFLRLQQENKIRFEVSKKKPYAFFNTGLRTESGKYIFATFRPNHKAEDNSGYPDWCFRKWCKEDSSKLEKFSPLPEPASYIQNEKDTIFDASYQVDVDLNMTHVVRDNKARLPEALQENNTLAIAAIDGAINQLIKRCKNNDIEAVPFWYAARQKIQLLLPLYITNPNTADAALVADKNTARREYQIRTVLTLDMAYSNARLLRRPKARWLNP